MQTEYPLNEANACASLKAMAAILGYGNVEIEFNCCFDYCNRGN